MNTPTSFAPRGLEIKSHFHHLGIDFIKPLKIKLCAYGRQNHCSWETGHDIKKYVSNPLCADVLDYLLEHPEKIPEEWKGKLVFFWGTIYRTEECMPVAVAKMEEGVLNKSGAVPLKYEVQYVRCLYFVGGDWKWDMLSLDDDFGPTRVSAELDTRKTLWDFIKRFFMWTT